MSMFKKKNSSDRSTEKYRTCDHCANADICRYKAEFIEMEEAVSKAIERTSACYQSSDLLRTLIICEHKQFSLTWN